MVIVSDPNAADFNCYASYDEAVVIAGERLYFGNWATATETDRKRALLMATSLLDQHVNWYGTAAAATQNLDWPRSGVQIAGRPVGTEHDSTTIPDFLKLATAEYANELLGADLTSDQETGLAGLSVGPISLSFNKSDRKDPVPEAVRGIVSQYGVVTKVNASSVRVVRR